MTAAVLAGDRLHVVHVGQTRAYRARGGRLEQLTVDDLLIDEARKLGWSEERLAELPRNVVTKALGLAETVAASARTVEVQGGDVLLLCTDGLTVGGWATRRSSGFWGSTRRRRRRVRRR